MKAQIHQRSTGADFQVKKEGAGAGTSKAASEKKAKREERSSLRTKAGYSSASERKHDELNEDEWLAQRTPAVLGNALEQLNSQEKTKTKIRKENKLKNHKKPSQLEGIKLEKWLKKCFQRRQQEKANKSIEGLPNDNQPWVYVERTKIKSNSMLRVATWNVRTIRTLTDITLVAEDLKKHKILIAGLQECRWLTDSIGRKVGDYKFWGGGAWKNGVQAAQGGVAIAAHKSLWRKVHPTVWKNGCYHANVTVGQKNCVLHGMVPGGG